MGLSFSTRTQTDCSSSSSSSSAAAADLDFAKSLSFGNKGESFALVSSCVYVRTYVRKGSMQEATACCCLHEKLFFLFLFTSVGTTKG